MEELEAEYQAWVEEQKLPKLDAGALMASDLLKRMGFEDEHRLTDDQRAWLMEFEERWDRQQELVDRLANLRHLTLGEF